MVSLTGVTVGFFFYPFGKLPTRLKLGWTGRLKGNYQSAVSNWSIKWLTANSQEPLLWGVYLS